MKALFEQSPFPPLRLAPSECQRFERLARELLHQALDEYERFGPPQHRQLSKAAWKVVKSHESCTVYLDRQHAKKDKHTGSATAPAASSGPAPFDPYNVYNHHSTAVFSSSDDSSSDTTPTNPGDDTTGSSSCDWKNTPELVLSGAVPGTLDDVLYGMSACDSAEVLLRTAYVDDHLLDGAVLQQLAMPTPTSPFRFLGLKWCVKEVPGQYKKLLWPRDFLYLEASGVTTRADGSRIGYLLRHPVNLVACAELSQRGVMRGRMAMSAIYTPLSNNTVDIFARGRVDLGGKGSHSLALSMSANALLSSADAVVCAHNKKLVWLLREQQRNGGANAAIPVVRSNMFSCGMCSKKFGKLSSVGTCRVCCVQMCSRCRMNRSLSFVNEQKDLQVEQIGGVFCKNCIAHANQSSAFQVASDEVRCGRYGPVIEQHSGEEATEPQAARSQTQTQTTATSTRDRMQAVPMGWTSYADAHGHHPHHSRAVPAPASSSNYSNTQQQSQHQPRLAPLPPRALATQRSLKTDAIASLSLSSTSSSAPTVSFDSNMSSSADLSRDSNGSSYSYSSDIVYDEPEEVSGDEIGGEFREWTHQHQQQRQQHDEELQTALPLALPTQSHPYQYQYHQQQPPQPGGVDPNQQRQELWRKMTELRLQAESVYQLTKKNSSLHMTGNGHFESNVETLD